MNSIDKITIADELAQLIYQNSDDTATMAELAGQLSLSLTDNDSSEDPPPADAPKDSIGIWKRELRKGEVFWVRDPGSKEEYANYWAQMPVIPPKGAKKRFIFLGESVARGYLYDPYYNCAQVLQGILDQSGHVQTEIIDLARTNMDLIGLDALTDDCLALDPDGFVIFAGNNWIHSLKAEFNTREMVEGGEIWKRDGFDGLRNFLTDKCKVAILKYMQRLSAIATSRNIPIIFIIPEFNLGDWKTTVGESILSALPNEMLKKWTTVHTAALKALSAGNWEQALATAKELIGLDISHPTGYDIAAEASLKLGAKAEARNYFEASRDTALFARSCSKPRRYSFARDLLLKEAANYHIHLIDLPEVFSQATGGDIPGRNLFLDYCHLSEKGIQLSMGATAQLMIRLLTGKNIPEADLHAERFQPTNEVRALAYLAASVHNAHYGQPAELLEYLCRSALENSPVAVEVMTSYADFSSRKTTNTLCKSHELLVDNERINQYGGGLGFMHKRNGKIMDVPLVDAMVRVLENKGFPISDKVNELRQTEHGLGNNERIDLIEKFYSTDSYDEFTGNTPEYLQCRNTSSRFTLVARDAQSAMVKLVYRTPFRQHPEDKIHVSVNGHPIMELPTSRTWQSRTCLIPATMFQNGINYIDIQWASEFAFEENTRQSQILEDFIFNQLYHVYGELSTFTITAD